MGLYYYRHNDRKRALSAFERATALDRTAHLSFYYQGLLRRDTPNGFESSFEALTRSVEARSSFAPSQLLLARLTAEYGRNLREGADAARRAVALTPLRSIASSGSSSAPREATAKRPMRFARLRL